jgi:PAS domain S-box-containing protein
MSAARPRLPLLAIDGGRNPGAALLGRLSLIITCTLAGAALVEALAPRLSGVVALGTGAALSLMAHLFARRGSVQLAANLSVGSVWLSVSVHIWLHGGMRDLAMLAYPGILILSALLLHRSLHLVLLVSTIATVVALGAAEILGWLVTPFSAGTRWTAVASLVVILVAFALLGQVMVRRLVFSADQASQARAALELANEQLRGQAQDLQQEGEQRTAFLHRQFSVSRELLHSTAIMTGDVTSATRAVCEAACEVLLVARASVWTFEDEATRLRCNNLYIQNQSHSGGQELHRQAYPAYFAALLQDRVIAASDAHTDRRTSEFSLDYLTPLGIGAMLDVPLTQRGHATGVLCLEHVGGPRSWTTAEQAFAASLADHLQIAHETRERLQAQEQAQQAYRQSEEMFYSTFHESPLMMAVSEASGQGRLIDVNAAFEQVLGYRREDVLGLNGAEVGYWSEDTQNMLRDLLVRERSITGVEVVLRTTHGEERIALVSARLRRIREDWRLFWYSTDITDMRRARQAVEDLNRSLEHKVAERTEALELALQRLQEAQQEIVQSEKIKALDTIVAGVAHELNTPIGNALTVATTLEEKTRVFMTEVNSGALRRTSLSDYTAVAEEASRLIARNLHAAGELVRSFKQVTVDQASAHRRKFDLKQTLEELLTTLKHRTKGQSVSLHTSFEEGLLLDSYPGPLGQVVTNLVTNALTHAFDGRPQGSVTLKTYKAANGQVCLECADDGSGIPQADLPRLFDPFFTTKLGRGGSGLGMPIVQSIVTGLLGGRIKVESEDGKGTRIFITMPLEAPRQAAKG